MSTVGDRSGSRPDQFEVLDQTYVSTIQIIFFYILKSEFLLCRLRFQTKQ